MPPPPEPSPAPTPALPRRRWLRLSLRGLMILVIPVAALAGWVAQTIRTQRQAVAAIKAAGGQVRYDFQLDQVGVTPGTGRPVYRKEPAAPAWLRRWLGDELFQSVRRVYFNGPLAAPDVLTAVAQCDRLEMFTLGGAAGIGDRFRLLRKLSRLEEVWIAGPGITDAMLGDLAQIASIRRLSLGRPTNPKTARESDVTSPVTDAGLAHLAALRNLESLNFEYCPHLTDAGLAPLVGALPPLQTFGLNRVPTTLTATLPALARRHPNLEVLILDQTGITDADLKAVAKMVHLQAVHLQSTRIGDAGVAHLAPLKSLNSLMFNNTDITDEGLKVLGELPLLETLSLNKTRVTDAGLVHLGQLKNLKLLFLGLCPGITDAGMPAVAQLTGLNRLSLSYSPGITDAGLIPLRSLTQLQQIELVDTRVTPGGVAALNQALPKLTRVTSGARPRSTPTPAAK